MRLVYPFLTALIICCVACHSSPGGAAVTATAGLSEAEAGRYMGTYSGSFNKGIMTLVINYISGRTVSGYNIHKGLRRNFNGEVSREGSALNFVLKEPGDNPFDGTFYFALDTTSLLIRGKWVANDSAKLSTKKLALSRRPETEEVMGANQWTTLTGRDTTLNFSTNGTCEYTFYERPGDSTSQLITVRGNYEKQNDTFRIEWGKNTHTPAQTMKMILRHVKLKTADGENYEEIHLAGHGLELREKFEAG